MWVFTTQGFYSVVAHRDDATRVIVRPRAREDLEALRAQIRSLRIYEDESADYRFRAVVDHADWIAALAILAAGVDYPNFKAAVGERQGADRAGRLRAGVARAP
jgi:hypothetical protein